jgi:lipopolysaccharide biosynthesis glycosyltransferase
MESTAHPKNTITIDSTIGENYALPLNVTAASLLNNKGRSCKVEWYVFESDLTDETKSVLERVYRDTDITFHWVHQPLSEFEHLPQGGRGLARMYQRLAIADSFPPELTTLLYLDADLLVLGNIEELMLNDLENDVVGAVQDMAVPTVSSPLGLHDFQKMNIPPDKPCFNAGVLLMNLSRWKQEHVAEKALPYLESGIRIRLLDQDALNAVLYSAWKPLHYRWNVIGSIAGRPFFKAKHLNKKQYMESLSDPAIIHFGGYMKPWLIQKLGNKWDDEYNKVLANQGFDFVYQRSAKTAFYSLYDRYFRSCLYPVERAVWKHLY